MGTGRGIAKGWNPIIEAAIREHLKKPLLPYNKSTGNWPKNQYLTEADLEKVTELFFSGNQLNDVKGLEKLDQLKELWLGHNQLTSVKGLEKLTQLKLLDLRDNPALTKAQIDQLQKALSNCKIISNATL